MELGDKNIHSQILVSKSERLLQHLEDFKLAKQRLISGKITRQRMEGYDHNKVKPTAATSGDNPDVTKCWHKFIRKNSNPVGKQSASPCFCQKFGQWSPFPSVKQHGIHAWTKENPDTPKETGVSSETHCRSSRVPTTPIMSGDCCNHKAMNTGVRRSFNDSSPVFSSSEAECEVKSSSECQKLISPVISSRLYQGSNLRDSLAWEPTCSSISQTEVLKSMYIPSEDERDTNSFSPVCSCCRPPKLILCKSCGKTMTGRVRKRCQMHPKQMYLMDLLCCTQCESKDLKEV